MHKEEAQYPEHFQLQWKTNNATNETSKLVTLLIFNKRNSKSAMEACRVSKVIKFRMLLILYESSIQANILK